MTSSGKHPALLIALAVALLAMVVLLAREGPAPHREGSPPSQEAASASREPQAAPEQVLAPVTERVTPGLVIAVEDDAGNPVPGALAFFVDATLRTLSSDAAIATADGAGRIDLSAATRGQPDRVVAVAAHGHRTRRVCRAGSITDGAVIRLERAIRIAVRLLEGTRPITDTNVLVSRRDLPREVPQGSARSRQIAGPDAPLSIARTDSDGIAWIDAPEPGLCFIAAQLDAYLCVDGMPLRKKLERDGEVVELQARRIYGCRIALAGDRLLSTEYTLPAEFETSPTTAPFLHDMQRREGATPGEITILTSLREPLADSEAGDAPREIVLHCWISRRGLVRASVPLRWVGLGLRTVTIDAASFPEQEHGTATLSFRLSGHGPLREADLPLHLLKLDGEHLSCAIALTQFDGTLPAGDYVVGHRHDDVLGACVVEPDARFTVNGGSVVGHNVELAYLPRRVQIGLRTVDGVTMRGAQCVFTRQEACERPGPRLVTRIHPDLTTASFWLPPGRWALEVKPFDGSGAQRREFELPTSASRDDPFRIE